MLLLGIKAEKKSTTSQTGLRVVVSSPRNVHSSSRPRPEFCTSYNTCACTSTRYVAVYVGVSSCTLEVCGI